MKIPTEHRFPAIYLQVGGFDGISPIDTVECYNQSTNTWSSMGRMISARRGAGVTNLNDKIYAVGGYDGECPICRI